jgi:hypothetical protein
MLTALTEKGSKRNVDHVHQFLQCQSALQFPFELFPLFFLTKVCKNREMAVF